MAAISLRAGDLKPTERRGLAGKDRGPKERVDSEVGRP